MLNRREFFRNSAIAAAAGLSCKGTAGTSVSTPAFELGVASYTFRAFDLQQTLEFTNRLGVKNIAFKSMHLPLDSTDAQIKSAIQTTTNAGIHCYGCGVVYMKSKEEVDRAFEYARIAGMKTIIGVPEPEWLQRVSEKAAEYDIQVAIHNHGPEDETYPTPESIYEKITDLDPRLGICVDIGHTKRAGVNPAEAVRQFSDRVLDVHIKDVNKAKAAGETVEIGRGVIDIPEFLKALIGIGYSGYVSLEYEKDKNDPIVGAAESVGYVRGVLAAL